MYESYIGPALDQSVSLRRQVTVQAMRVFSGWGYGEIQVPLLDQFEPLKGVMDESERERTFRFVDRSGNLMMLRSDLTPAVARLVSYQLPNKPGQTRVAYANKIVRVERSLGNANFESYQLGIEQFGAVDLASDLEVFLIALETMERLGIRDFQLNVSDYGVVRYLLNATGAPARIRKAVHEAIIGRDPSEVHSILQRLGIRERYVTAIAALASLEGGLYQLSQIEDALPDDTRLVERLTQMRTLFHALSELGYKKHIRLDMAEIGGASYYTGISFNIVSESLGHSIGRGGRYDDLLSNFGVDASAVGFSLSTESLVELIQPTATNVRQPTNQTVAVGIDGDDIISGFEQVLERRRYNKRARVVFEGRS